MQQLLANFIVNVRSLRAHCTTATTQKCLGLRDVDVRGDGLPVIKQTEVLLQHNEKGVRNVPGVENVRHDVVL